jgi:integrase
MAVRELANKKYRADWRDEFGIRRRKDFKLKTNAKNHEEAMRLKARESKTGETPASDTEVTLTEYARRWIDNRPAQGIDPGTVARQEINLRRHVLPRFGTTKVREIHRSAVKAFLLDKLSQGTSDQGLRPGRGEKRTRKPLARGSVRGIYHTLSGILTEAVDDRLIKANPISGLWKRLNKSAKVEVVKVKALDTDEDNDEARRFLTAAVEHTPRHYPYFCTLMLAGLRPGEGFALKAEKVYQRKRSIIVDAQIHQHGGFKTTKTGEERPVDMSAALADVLAQAMKAVKVVPKVVTISGTPHDEEGNRPRGPWLFYPELGPTPGVKEVQRVYKNALRAMRLALKKADLPSHYTLHSLRHTYGSGLISRGVSPAYVQAQMGHASIEQTVKTYGSWFPVRVPGAVDALSKATIPDAGHQMDTSGVFDRAEAL